MTFKEQIKKLANSKAYSRGLEIYNKGKILRFQAEENNREEMVLEALVKGSGQNRYSVYLIWDTVRDEMVEADCECPAFREYEGICKHCVAVLLQYYSDSRVKAYREKLEQEKREKLLQKGSGAKNHGRNPSASEKKCRCQKSSTDPGRHLWKSTAGTALDCGKPKCCVAL